MSRLTAIILALALGSVGCATSGDVSELNDRLDSIDPEASLLVVTQLQIAVLAPVERVNRVAHALATATNVVNAALALNTVDDATCLAVSLSAE